jgi:hypothetical protein
MAMKESDTASSAPAPSAPTKTKRFWNWKLIGIEIIVIALAIYAFLRWAPRLSGMVGFAVAILGVWLLTREFRGLSINSKVISLPSGRLGALPILSLKRRKVHPDALRELTVTPPWYSFQIVHIQGEFGSELLVFQSRGQRLRFMNAVEKICPNVQMYRRIQPMKAQN